MVVDCKQGRIYKIVAPCGLTYYGSTCGRIMDRMMQHKKEPKNCTAKKVIDAGGEIFLVEMYPCNSEKELWAREGWYQRNRPCVNKRIECRSKKEYYQDKREEILEKKKRYHIQNRDKNNNRCKERYRNNKQAILRKQGQPYNCECGSTVRRNDKARHFRSKKHQLWAEQNQ